MEQKLAAASNQKLQRPIMYLRSSADTVQLYCCLLLLTPCSNHRVHHVVQLLLHLHQQQTELAHAVLQYGVLSMLCVCRCTPLPLLCATTVR